MRKSVVITQENFDELLAWLHPDREQAGLKYEPLRRSLIKIFAWRGCMDAEGLADETINRVADKVHQLRTTFVGDPSLYFYGVANHLIKEDQKQRAKFQARMEEAEASAAVSPPQEEEDEDLEQEYECFRACLEKLDPGNRELIVAYYLKEKRAKIDHRKELAKRLGIGLNALRVRMRRIRAALEECIEDCLKQLASREMD